MRVITIDAVSTRLMVELEPAVAWLAAGGVLVVPTDTYYGLATNPESDTAVETVFSLKGRRREAALPLVGSSLEQVEDWCGALDTSSHRLATTFWPGPLAVICVAPAACAEAVHGGTGTVAVRVPAHPVARALAAGAGRPVTATSANASGDAPARTIDQLGNFASDPRVLVLDAGTLAGGRPSTIVDARRRPPTLLRDGAIAWDRVLESLQG